jgi:hypothetical protein
MRHKMIEINLYCRELCGSKPNLRTPSMTTQHTQIFQCTNSWCRNPQHTQSIETEITHLAMNLPNKLIPDLV